MRTGVKHLKKGIFPVKQNRIMKISITVKTNAKRPGVEKQPDGSYRVAVKSPPTQGKANEEVIEILAKHFSLPKRSLRIKHGRTGKRKIMEID